jgi:hypothetical protein
MSASPESILAAKLAACRLGANVALVITIHPGTQQIQIKSGSWGTTKAECATGRVLLDAAHEAVMETLKKFGT